MLSFRTLLVPCDRSAGSGEALRYALALRCGESAIARGARIRVVEALNGESGRGLTHDERAEAFEARAVERLRAFVSEITGDSARDVECSVVPGDPRRELPLQAASADLVVIGATGRLSPGEVVPGGVAEAVVRRSPAPVLTVKWLSTIAGASGELIGPTQIVFATDFTEFSAYALRYALAFAFASGARVTALHVVPDAAALRTSRRLPFPLAAEIDKFYAEELAWQKDELGRFVRDRLGVERPIEIREVVRAGRPGDEIAAECHDCGADLLVLATHGAGGLRRGIIGSVAERALRLAPCPTLTVRPPEPPR